MTDSSTINSRVIPVAEDVTICAKCVHCTGVKLEYGGSFLLMPRVNEDDSWRCKASPVAAPQVNVVTGQEDTILMQCADVNDGHCSKFAPIPPDPPKDEDAPSDIERVKHALNVIREVLFS